MSSFRDDDMSNSYLRTNYRRSPAGSPNYDSTVEQVTVQGRADQVGDYFRKYLRSSTDSSQRKIIYFLEVRLVDNHVFSERLNIEITLWNGSVRNWNFNLYENQRAARLSAALILDGSEEVYLTSTYDFEVNAIINIVNIAAAAAAQVPITNNVDSWNSVRELLNPFPSPMPPMPQSIPQPTLNAEVSDLVNRVQQIILQPQKDVISVRIPVDMKEELERFAAQHNMTLTELVQSVLKHLKEYAGLPPATNPRVQGVIEAALNEPADKNNNG